MGQYDGLIRKIKLDSDCARARKSKAALHLN